MLQNTRKHWDKWEILWKKVFLEISQNSQENTCATVFFLIKLHVGGLAQETLGHVFLVKFAKFLKPYFFTEHLWTENIDIKWLKWQYCFLKKLTKFYSDFAKKTRFCTIYLLCHLKFSGCQVLISSLILFLNSDFQAMLNTSKSWKSVSYWLT